MVSVGGGSGECGRKPALGASVAGPGWAHWGWILNDFGAMNSE